MKLCLIISAMSLLSLASMATVARAKDAKAADAIPADAAAWKHLPEAKAGAGSPLPSWARMIAAELPRSTAAFLELDYAQRTQSPVDPKLRAAMRWVSAHANGSTYAEAYAAADARRAGLDESLIAALGRQGYPGWSDPERAALEFARKMTVASDTVTDAEFADLVKHFGEKKTASMVLLLAYSNFQDRVLICLGAPIEEGGPRPPLDVKFDRSSFVTRQGGVPATAPKASLAKPTGKDVVADESDWAEVSYETLQARLEAQRRRPTRLRIPSWDEVARNLPPGLMSKPSDIVWYRIAFGYAPELAVPFEVYMRTAGAEAAPKYNRVFGQSLFWVTTRAMKCPYCMGHCEMNWEVAGLTKDDIAERSRLLSGDDWSSFPAEEQKAFAFARKLTTNPKSVSRADLEALQADFGPDKGLIVMLNAARHHYMTRISNGFQLTLERENVFYDYHNVPAPGTAGSGASDAKVASRPTPGPVELLSDEETWKRMPKADEGSGQPLPSWAKAVAVQLPRTAAAMLELDLAQRTKSPLPPALRAKMRWVIAHANHCDYSEAYALADLKRAGGDDAAVKALTGGPSAWSPEDREPLEFARLHTVDAPSIPDALFASLRKRFGDKGVASMVLLGAYGNFQDRIVLGLNLPMEQGGPLAPLKVKFVAGAFQSVPLLPDTPKVPTLLTKGNTVVDRDPEWDDLSYDTLQSRLETQRAREPRLPIPSWDEVKKGLPPAIAARPTKIVWNLVCSGYVPELAVPWSVSTRTMWAEAKPDRVFEESLFWVQTRAIRCNYCMGHCEMLLEVAGLDKDAVADRTRKLAGDDWSAFPPSEQRAYAYARKLTKTPWQLTADDYKTLESDLGPHQAMGTFWWLCRGLYMTRVSDGFQLPLERENVFRDFYVKPASKPKD